MANYNSSHTGATIDAAVTKIQNNTASSGQILIADGSGSAAWANDPNVTNLFQAVGDLIVGAISGTYARLAKGNNGELLTAGTSGLSWGNALPITTTEPTAANTNGIIICVLSSEPATYYNGYLYLITGA